MAPHVLWMGDAQRRDGRLVFTGDEAKHALRVKRLRDGERVLALDGSGTVIEGSAIGVGRELIVEVEEERSTPPVNPSIEVWAPAPKGSRVGDMVDLLSQAGASAWIPMKTERSVSELTPAKRRRLERVAVEACKQSRRAWLLKIGEEAPLSAALRDDGAALVLAEQSGEAMAPISAERIRLLIGPEGGFTKRETERILDAGASTRSLGPHVMRIEAAAVAGCATLLAMRR